MIETAPDANPPVPLRAQMSKAYTYAAPKLFLNELLPNVDQALLLDTDIIVLADVCELTDGFAAVTARPENPLMALGYALEQQGEYRWVVQWSSPDDASPRVDSQGLGFNGGVAVHRLDRLRGVARAQYYNVLGQMLKPAQPHPSCAPNCCSRRLIRCAVGSSGRAGKDQRFREMLAYMLGDQTVLTVASATHPGAMRQLMSPLPCEWNWQACFDEYARQSQCFNDQKFVKSRACFHRRLTAQRDFTCRKPPALLHFNCPKELKDLLQGEDTRCRGRDDVSFSEGLEWLRQGKTASVKLAAMAMHSARSQLRCTFDQRLALKRDCAMAEAMFPELPKRLCNASFLLSGPFQAQRETVLARWNSPNPTLSEVLARSPLPLTPWASPIHKQATPYAAVAREQASIDSTPVANPLTERWMDKAAHGYCETTLSAGDCANGVKGRWSLHANETVNWNAAATRCLSMCASCARCRYISVSMQHADCSWFSACKLDQLEASVVGFRSGLVFAS